jgi:hypothetical protein
MSLISIGPFASAMHTKSWTVNPGLEDLPLPRFPLGLDTAPGGFLSRLMGGFVSTLMGGFVSQMLVGEVFGASVVR